MLSPAKHYSMALIILGALAVTYVKSDDKMNGNRRLDKLSGRDQARAYMAVPPHGSPVLGDNQEEIPIKLNAWLLDAFPESALKPCEEFEDLDELNAVIAMILELRHPDLQQIYNRNCQSEDGCDNRALPLDIVEDYESKWDAEFKTLQSLGGQDLGSIMHEVFMQKKCADAVMWFQHHLSEDSRQELLGRDGFVLPLMSEDIGVFDTWQEILRNEEIGNRRGLEAGSSAEKPACAICHLNKEETGEAQEDEPV